MNITEELAKLEEMHRKGTLNDEEFRKAKAAVLGGQKKAAAASQPVAEPTAPKTSSFFDPESNAKALVRIILILVVLGASLWLLVSWLAGPKAATNLAKTVVHAPVTLRDSVENVKASSWQGVPLNLPYSGTLTLSVEVQRGNKIDVCVVDEANMEKFKTGDKKFRVSVQAAQTQNVKQSVRLKAGSYYLVLRDTSMGVLSSQTSDIKVLAKLE